MADLHDLNPEFFKPYLTILHYFRQTGIDIFEEKNTFLFKIKYINFIIFLFYILNAITHWQYVIQEVQNGTNLVELSVDLSYSSNSIEGCLIYFYICLIKNRIKSYVMKLEREWRDDNSLTPKAVLLKRNQVKELDLNNYVYCTFIRMFVHFYMAFPLIIVLIKKYILNCDVTYATPMQFVLPFNYQNNIVIYVIVYFMNYAIACSLGSLINCGLFFIVVTMNQLYTLFVLLKEDFEDVITMKDPDQKLKQTIHRHSVLSDLLRDLSDAYGAIFSIHISFLSAAICFYGIAGMINRRVEDFKNFVISGLLTITIYYCCKHGQLVTDSASDIAVSIYNSPWEDLSCTNKKIIILTLLRSQRATYVRSMNFTEISLNTFIMIMKMSWSFISLITKLYSN